MIKTRDKYHQLYDAYQVPSPYVQQSDFCSSRSQWALILLYFFIVFSQPFNASKTLVLVRTLRVWVNQVRVTYMHLRFRILLRKYPPKERTNQSVLHLICFRNPYLQLRTKHAKSPPQWLHKIRELWQTPNKTNLRIRFDVTAPHRFLSLPFRGIVSHRKSNFYRAKREGTENNSYGNAFFRFSFMKTIAGFHYHTVIKTI